MARDTGDLDYTGWLPCHACGGEGGQDAYEDDAINYSPGELWEKCDECRGEGGHHVCPDCCTGEAAKDVDW